MGNWLSNWFATDKNDQKFIHQGDVSNNVIVETKSDKLEFIEAILVAILIIQLIKLGIASCKHIVKCRKNREQPEQTQNIE